MKAELLAALIAVESGGNDLARGRHGELGALQVRPCVVADVNRVVRGNYRWSEMTNRVVATKVADIYLTHWAKRIGRPATDRDLALIWHHGPNGWKRSGGVYWKRVRDRVVAGKVRDRVVAGKDRVVAGK
jgi:hypothetical protein